MTISEPNWTSEASLQLFSGVTAFHLWTRFTIWGKVPLEKIIWLSYSWPGPEIFFDAPRNTDFQELACWENTKVPILGNLLPCLLASQIFCQDGCWVNIWSAPLVESNPWFLDEKTLVLPSTTCWAKLHIFICQDCLLIKQIWVSFLSSYYLLQNTVMSNNFGLYFLANVYLPGKTAPMLLIFSGPSRDSANQFQSFWTVLKTSQTDAQTKRLINIT